jgi:hypothetical protein
LETFKGKRGRKMKKTILIIGLVLAVLVGINCVAIAEVPKTFSPGTTAKSSDVNANFQYVNYGNIVVKASGVEIGTLLSIRPSDGIICFLSPQGYMAEIYVNSDFGTGTSPSLYPFNFVYTTNDCTGTAYVYSFEVLPGEVIGSYSNSLYYVEKSAVPSTFIYQSCNTGTVCHLYPYCGTGNTEWTPVLPNDPSVTGISSNSLLLPITIERR